MYSLKSLYYMMGNSVSHFAVTFTYILLLCIGLYLDRGLLSLRIAMEPHGLFRVTIKSTVSS